ncbi:MAG: tyrosine-type recombinase/integrase, partial [Phycicoccus sp.]
MPAQLQIGQHGRITVAQLGPRLYEALARVRDADGKVRRAKRQGRSKTAAENALRQALAARRHTAGAGVTGASRVREAGERWLAQQAALVEAGDRSPRTYETYLSSWRTHVLPALGELQLREATTGRCEAWLVELRRRRGASTCSTARAVLGGVLGWAARMETIPSNPVRDLSPIPGAGRRKRKPRAMTEAERTGWLAWMDTHAAVDPDPRHRGGRPARPRAPKREADVAKARALGDVTRFMLGTGCRIGEAMAVSWDEVDLDAGTVAIAWHLVRVRGQGIVRLPGAKSEAGDRLLRVPSWCTTMLLERRTDPRSGYPVFPDELGGWRDANLVMRWFRWSGEQAGYGWVTSHVFRQTVLTVLDEAGLDKHEVRD